MIPSQLVSSGKDDWATPPELMAFVRDTYGEPVADLAASRTTAKAPLYFGPDHEDPHCRDVLSFPFLEQEPSADPPLLWCNPPYSKEAGGLYRWTMLMRELSEKGYAVAATFFAKTETRAWHENVVWARDVWFIRRRLKFIDPATGKPRAGAPQASVLAYWYPGHLAGPTYRNLDLRSQHGHPRHPVP